MLTKDNRTVHSSGHQPIYLTKQAKLWCTFSGPCAPACEENTKCFVTKSPKDSISLGRRLLWFSLVAKRIKKQVERKETTTANLYFPPFPASTSPHHPPPNILLPCKSVEGLRERKVTREGEGQSNAQQLAKDAPRGRRAGDCKQPIS